MKTLVMKFGGAALESPEHFGNVATIIIDKRSQYDQIIVVVSAMRGVTDELTKLAHLVSRDPVKREVDMLISVGERVSMSLLAMALEDRGVHAISLTGSQSGIITCNSHREAKIQRVHPVRILEHLKEGKVVIVAGFQGVSTNKEITTLGRGGSDTSAVALGVALQAEKVEFYKDVKGIYTNDPKKDPEAKLLERLTYDEALAFANPLHPRSILLASKNGLPLHVITFNRDLWKHFSGTWIVGTGHHDMGPIYESDRSD